MAKLAVSYDVRDVLRMDEIPELITSIDSALEVATSQLQAMLRVDSFDQAATYDIFRVEERITQVNATYDPMYEYHWRLANGFVDSGETLTVKVAARIADFAGSDYTDITSLSNVQYDKGTVSYVDGKIEGQIISTTGGKLIGNFVRVDYTSGFTESGGEYQNVPEWLKQAAILQATIHLDSVQPDLRHTDNKVAKESIKYMKKAVFDLIAPHIRYYPRYQDPIVKVN